MERPSINPRRSTTAPVAPLWCDRRHLDTLEADVRAGGIRVPLVLALNRSHGFLDGNYRLAVARRWELPEVPVDVWTAPEHLRTEYGRPVSGGDLTTIQDRLRLAGPPTTGSPPYPGGPATGRLGDWWAESGGTTRGRGDR